MKKKNIVNNIVIIIVIIIVIVVVFFYLFNEFFNRIPNRSLSTHSDGTILSPCDGTVSNINGSNISIFLSPLDVHAQYVPIDSTVRSIEMISGSHKMANTPESIHNEGVKVIFSSKLGDIEVTQRVGFLARRIQNYIKPGDILKRGFNYGRILFGSRVDIVLPVNSTRQLKIGDKVYAGITPIS